MKQYCQITVLGYVSSEVESGKGKVDLATFPIISNLDYKQSQGSKKSYKLYFKIVTLGAFAKHIEKFVKVGDQVLVVGELKTNNWKGKTTNEIWSKEVRVLKEKPDDDSEVPESIDIEKI
jgi:single-stranded DNA-binding protein